MYSRRMQDVPFSILLFYLGLLSFPIAVLTILVESLLLNQNLRILTYSTTQYISLITPSFVNFFVLLTQCIAMQNDNPAFLTILGYSSLIYAFAADTFIFKVSVNGL